MEIHNIEFKGSFPTYKQCPETNLPEFAFIGRSNVGKSSLINMLSNRKKLAKVSNTPGKTQTINFFLVDESWYLVDLPGFGYAKVSKSLRADWSLEITEYVAKRSNLQTIFMLVDLRIPPQKIDLEFIDFMGKKQISFVLVFTKTDKLKKAQVLSQLETFKAEMLKTWDSLPQYFLSSAVERSGREDILKFIGELNVQASIDK